MQLTDPITSVPMVGTTYAKRLKSLGIENIRDLLFYLPRAYDDQREVQTIETAVLNEKSTFKGHVSKLVNIRTRRGKTMTKGIFTDDSGCIEVIWFNQPYLKQTFKKDEPLYLSGKIKRYGGKSSLQSPQFEKVGKTQIHTGRLVPIYPETEGISSKWLRHKIHLVLDLIKEIPEYHQPEFLKTEGLLPIQEALTEIHFPNEPENLAKAKYRLGFDELFFIQLHNLIKKKKRKDASHSPKIPLNKELIKKAINSLPFELTKAQKLSLFEILEDLKQELSMHRLLEGDVGSGKTIVAGLSILNCLAAGYQAALMAPTSILASQHFSKLMNFMANHGFSSALLLGSTKTSEKKRIINGLATGTTHLVIGTHALVQENVKFNKLGLAIIDEQHRFGVEQRKALTKHSSPHILNMTATPIPRTIALTIFGSQDISIIDELPKGRQKITTRLVPKGKREDAYKFIEKHLESGRQAFVICPLIEESEKLDAKSVKEVSEKLQKRFAKYKLASLHGKLKATEKEQIMQDFKDKKYDILVSTSVVEVGIDVQNATIMMIEAAERFGLAQLHQFRGRVGRGSHKSFCLLFSDSSSEGARKRLLSMESIDNGFELAKIDLEMRGPGEVFGSRQSGIPDLRMANLTDQKLIYKTHNAAKELLEEDPELEKHESLATAHQEFIKRYIHD